MKKVITAVSALIIANTAFAESESNFSGLSVGLNGQFKSTTARAKVDGVKFDALGGQDEVASINADYGFNLGNRFILLAGGTYDLNDTDIFKLSGFGAKYQIKEKNHYSVYLAPGFELTENTLGYFKLAYHHSEFDTSNNFGVKNYNQNIHGLGLGLGLRSQLYNSVYANLEVQRVMYNSESIVSTNVGTGTTIGSIGVSYNFNDNKTKSEVFDAESSSFKGLSIGLNGQLKSNTSEIRIEDLKIDSLGKQSVVANLSVDYTIPVANRMAVLVGANVDLNNNESFKFSVPEGNFKVKEKNHYSLYLAPGYQVTPSTLAYVKAAYHHAKLRASDTDDVVNESEAVSGYGFGVGLRTKIHNNIYANLEVQKVIYDSERVSFVKIDPESVIGSVGI